MSDTLASLRRKIDGAGDLESVVRSMKALAAASIGQYEKAVLALIDYYRTVELGLVVCLRKQATTVDQAEQAATAKTVSAIVFGSDQGLVGQFNDVLASFVAKALDGLSGEKKVWAVGERMHARLADAGLPPVGLFAVPTAVNAIAPLVGQILIESGAHHGIGEFGQLFLFHNSPRSGATYEPVRQHLLPLDEKWQLRLAHLRWPTGNLPDVIGCQEQTLRALVHEYFLFRSSRPALNRWPAKTQAAWPQCSEPRRTSTK
jgi:F-type H+-transporting ATPase subunit gamma